MASVGFRALEFFHDLLSLVHQRQNSLFDDPLFGSRVSRDNIAAN